MTFRAARAQTASKEQPMTDTPSLDVPPSLQGHDRKTRWTYIAMLSVSLGLSAIIFAHALRLVGSLGVVVGDLWNQIVTPPLIIGGLWLAFLGWFLNNAALMSYRQLLTREALEDIPVSRLMQTRFESVPPDTTISQLVEDHVLRSGQHAFPVVSDDRLLGMVGLSDITKVDPKRRATTTVAEIMTPAERLVSVAPDDDAFEALSLLAQRGLNQLPVVRDGRLRGLLRREEVMSWLALHEEPAATDIRVRERPA